MRNRALDPGNLEEVLLGFLDTLGNGCWNFLGLSVADADRTVTVTNDDKRGEAKATTTLNDLGHAVDRDNALEECGLLRNRGLAIASIATAPLVAAGTAFAALGCTHD